MAPLWKLLMVLLSLNLAIGAIDLIEETLDRSERNRQIEALRKIGSDVKALDEKLAALEKRNGRQLEDHRLELGRFQDEAQRLVERLQDAKLQWRKKTIMAFLVSLALLFLLHNKQLFTERPPGLSQAAT